MTNVALEGGPLDGWWYTAADWETARQAASNLERTKDQVQGVVLGYEATTRTVLHKRIADRSADVWRWTP